MQDDAIAVSDPSVSVVMSVYNGLPHLEHAITSILHQTLKNFEFLIVDDGSLDGSIDVIRKFASVDSRIIIIEQQNTGLTRALIGAAQRARGEFIARMDADDISEPSRLEAQVDALKSRLDAVAVSCRYWRINEVGEKLDLSPPYLDETVIAFAQNFVNIVGAHGHMLFRRDAYLAAGGYNPNFRYTQDYDLWNRMSSIGPILQLEAPLYQFRVGHESISTNNRPQQMELATKVSRRSIADLLGESLNDEQLGKLRTFCRRPSSWQLGPGDIKFIVSLLKRIDNALHVRHPYYTRSAVRRYLADLWLAWFFAGKGYPLLSRLNLMILALNARPGIAAQVLLTMASKVLSAMLPFGRKTRTVAAGG